MFIVTEPESIRAGRSDRTAETAHGLRDRRVSLLYSWFLRSIYLDFDRTEPERLTQFRDFG